MMLGKVPICSLEEPDPKREPRVGRQTKEEGIAGLNGRVGEGGGGGTQHVL